MVTKTLNTHIKGRRLVKIALFGTIACFSILIVLIIFNFITSDVSPQDKFENVTILDEKRQNFGDGSSYWHFKVDSNELKKYLLDFEVKTTDSRDSEFNYFWPEEAPRWFQPQRFGKDIRIFRRDKDKITEFFLVNRAMDEVYYQLTVR